MKAKVNERGVIIPKKLLPGIKEVEIRRENNVIVIVPLLEVDPIFDLGGSPVPCDAADASENHDKYLYQGT
jgi:virulence-associated protein VagC